MSKSSRLSGWPYFDDWSIDEFIDFWSLTLQLCFFSTKCCTNHICTISKISYIMSNTVTNFVIWPFSCDCQVVNFTEGPLVTNYTTADLENLKMFNLHLYVYFFAISPKLKVVESEPYRNLCHFTWNDPVKWKKRKKQPRFLHV